MIGYLKGVVLEKHPLYILIDVSGVGYEVAVPMTTLYRTPAQGEHVALYIQPVVREDAHLLYGFTERREREVFRELIRITGIGPKLALAIMSGLEVDDLLRCVQREDTATLVRIPGIGKKTAERLLIELRDRFKGWSDESLEIRQVSVEVPSDQQAEADAIGALVALGFKPQEASRALNAVREPGLSSEDLIRRALKSMV